MRTNNIIGCVERTTIIDTTTGEILDERTRRVAWTYDQVQRPDYRRGRRTVRRRRLPLISTREARDLLLVGLLVTVMGMLLWAAPSFQL